MQKNSLLDAFRMRALKSAGAGFLISISAFVYLKTYTLYSGIPAAVLFSFGLLNIVMFALPLFTGICGDKVDLGVLIFNFCGVAIGCALLNVAFPDIKDLAIPLCAGKFLQTPIETFVRAMFCGAIMYLAVKSKNILYIIAGVAVFILSGFEHSIADYAYMCFANADFIQVIYFLLFAVLGNVTGSKLMKVFGTGNFLVFERKNREKDDDTD